MNIYNLAQPGMPQASRDRIVDGMCQIIGGLPFHSPQRIMLEKQAQKISPYNEHLQNWLVMRASYEVCLQSRRSTYYISMLEYDRYVEGSRPLLSRI